MRSGSGGRAAGKRTAVRRAASASATGGGLWPDPCGKLAGSFGDGSRTIRGGFEGRLVAEARLDQAGDPGDGAEPGAGRARPVGTLAGSFREAGRNLQGRFENDSRTVRGGFEGRLAAEAPSAQVGDPGDGVEPCAGRARPVGTVAGSSGDGSRTIRGRFEGRPAAEAPSAQVGDPGDGAEPCDGGARPVGTVAGSFRGRFEEGSRASGRRKRRQTRPAAPAMARSLAMSECDRWGTLADDPGRGVQRERGISRWNGFMVKSFGGVHRNPARPRAEPSQVQAHPNRFRHPSVNR
jgi:hypothetical protein